MYFNRVNFIGFRSVRGSHSDECLQVPAVHDMVKVMVMHDSVPPYLADDCLDFYYSRKRHLRSLRIGTPSVPTIKNAPDARSFAVADLVLRNSLSRGVDSESKSLF